MIAQIPEEFATEFRRTELSGVPASGPGGPSVAGARSLGAFIEAIVYARRFDEYAGGPRPNFVGKAGRSVIVKPRENGYTIE